MTPRGKEHYEIARSFNGREFSRSEFRLRYRQTYPARPPGSIIPSDYCVDLHPRGAESLPKFLRRSRRARYQLIAGPKPS
jgi:hypothetical protein